jgi:hypothetical protein
MRTGMEKPQLTIAEHVRNIRDGVDYHAPLTAINPTIEGLVHCALVVRDHEVQLTPETRALDAIGVQVERELGNRREMILALVDRCNTLEAYVRDARNAGYITDAENIETQSVRKQLVQDMPSVSG